MKPLLKREYVNMPLSIPAPWREFFDNCAFALGSSRNGVMCQALRLGAPLLEEQVRLLKLQLKAGCEQLRSAVRPIEALPSLEELTRPDQKARYERRRQPSSAP